MVFEWHDDGWRKRFAILPVYLSDGPKKQIIWLQTYWSRFAGLYNEISLTDPRAAIAQTQDGDNQ